MPLYVKDEDVNALAERAQKLLKTASKTEAVKIALERVVAAERQDDKADMIDELRKLQAETLAMAKQEIDPNFDDKKFFDEMWGI